jgi:drug/metabolite transporter (DMT)-like permease
MVKNPARRIGTGRALGLGEDGTGQRLGTFGIGQPLVGQDEQITGQMHRLGQAVRHDVEDRCRARPEQALRQGRKRGQPLGPVAGRAGQRHQIVERRLSDFGALGIGQDPGGVVEKGARQPERGRAEDGKNGAAEQPSAQPSGFRRPGEDRAAQTVKCCHHVAVGEFERFGRVGARGIDGRHQTGIAPLDGGQRPMAERACAARIAQDQGRLAQTDLHLAALCAGRIAPQAAAFQPLGGSGRAHVGKGLLVEVAGGTIAARHGDANHAGGRRKRRAGMSLSDRPVRGKQVGLPGRRPLAWPQGPMPAQDRTLTAVVLVVIYATIVGYTDNYVSVISETSGLWQFHATRSVIAIAIFAAVAPLFRLRLWPQNPRAVLARSVLHAVAMLVYFGALAFLPVAVVAAGLFTAPIFVLLISRFAYGHPIGPVRIIAVAIGFAGVLIVLGPTALAGASLAAVLPVCAGALYAMGNIATREWCPGETAETLVAGFFLVLGIFGATGLAVLWFLAPDVPAGSDGFVLRGAVWPSQVVLFWTFVQAVGSMLAIIFMVRAYQIAAASRVAVLEYVILPISALWSFVLWGDRLSPLAIGGMGLIVLAGLMIVLRSAQGAPDETAARA